ncbi:predicted protein [Lichtheimia corymbifera JMRC:FSU:9682]|uniref:Uncharacterized protein n=1 Tax=Lichtheimia corymbifera JMRC:FSU:9682 TaxID=1263082 RepID=A0A068S8Y4_9FUNG|nr:predicted protein [Lichtheimia corymbifera JMRC:FSU:9682]
MKREVFNRTKLLVVVKRTLGASFTIVVAILRFTQCHHQPRRKKIRGRSDPLWLVVTLGETEISELDREISTQGALHLDEQYCSIEKPTFHCKV